MPFPPPDIRTIDTLQGTRFVLPSHPLLRVSGVFAFGFGVVFSGFAAFWILGAAGAFGGGGASPQGQAASVLSILFPLFGVPFFVVGLVPIAMGVTLLFGRPEFEIRDERFRSGPRLGPLHRSKWRPIDDIERLEVNRFGPSPNSPLHVLRVHVGEKFPMNITGSRDGAWLEQLARAIAARLDRAELFGDPPEVIVRDRDPDLEDDESKPMPIPISIEDPGPPPATSKLWVEDSPTGPTIFIPPRGIRGKPVPALLFFAVIWLAMTNAIGVAFVAGRISPSAGPIMGTILACAVLLIFESAGFGMLLSAISLARRRAILDVTDGGRTLLATRSGLRKSSQREVSADAISAIQVQNSGTTINDKPLRQVSIQIADEREIKLLTGAPEAELVWLAHKLRHALAAPG